MFEVYFPSAKRLGTICTVRYDTLKEAAEVCMAQYSNGRLATLRCTDPVYGNFQAGPMCANKWGARPIVQWWVSFTPNGIYKSLACRIAEDAGVRYASHRAGYRASRRAFQLFMAAMDAKIAAKLEMAA